MGIFINFDAAQEVCYYTVQTEKKTREEMKDQESFSCTRIGYLSPNWDINRPHRHVCRIEDLETVNSFLFISILCQKLHLIVIGLPSVRVEIFRPCANPIVEGYGGVHLRDDKR